MMTAIVAAAMTYVWNHTEEKDRSFVGFIVAWMALIFAVNQDLALIRFLLTA